MSKMTPCPRPHCRGALVRGYDGVTCTLCGRGPSSPPEFSLPSSKPPRKQKPRFLCAMCGVNYHWSHAKMCWICYQSTPKTSERVPPLPRARRVGDPDYDPLGARGQQDFQP